MKKWRPITLLNSDYKIYTKAVALRLQRVMGSLIHPNQTGFMPGRIIGDSIRSIEDSIDVISDSYEDGMIVALDFSKAFDSIRWSLILKTLEYFNFGECFVEYIKVLFINVESCLMNAGRTSQPFYPGQGIRQGCCASPYLFLLVAELLAISIRENASIEGIKFNGTEVKLTQFADDVTCMLTSETSLTNLIHTLETFSTWSGLKVNKSKTKILSYRATQERIDTLQGMHVTNKAKILGIWIGLENNEATRYEWNFKQQLQKIQGICESWAHRGLSLKGKTTVANALLLSLLQYQMSIIPTPNRVIKEYKAIISNFMWDNKRPKVAYKTMIQGIERGGMKLLDIETRAQVNMLQWIKRLLSNPEMNTAKILEYVWQTDSVKTFLSYRNPQALPPSDKFEFYRIMLKVWSKYRNFEPLEEAAIRRETIWFNNFVRPCSVMQSQRRWEKAGISTIGDLCHDTEARLLSHVEVSNKFQIQCTFLEALGLRMSIPARWRGAITKEWQPETKPVGLEVKIRNDPPEDIASLSAKKLYSKIILKDEHVGLHRRDGAEERRTYRYKINRNGQLLQTSHTGRFAKLSFRAFSLR